MGRQRKLIPALSILLVAGFLATSLTSYFVSRASLRKELIHGELPLTSDNIYSEIQQDLLRPISISSQMATDTFMRDWLLNGEKDASQISRFLAEIKSAFNTYTSFLVSEASHTYYHTDGILKQVDPTEERDVWYFRVRQMQADYEVNVDPDMANRDEMTIFINYRVFDYDNNYIGATGVGLTVNAVIQLIERYQAKYQREIYFADADGNVRLAGSNFPDTVRNIFTDDPPRAVFADLLYEDRESSFQYRRDRETIHVNARYIDELDWFLIVEQSETETIRDIFTTLIINLGVCALITAVMLLLVRLTIRRYQSNLEALAGIVPICSFCKKIRNDKGYWDQVEAYLNSHTDAQFSHGICPECMDKNFKDFMQKK